MEYKINKEDVFSFATIETKSNPTASALITIDLHEKNSLKNQSIQHLYSDALLSGNNKYNRDQFLNAINMLGANVSVSISNSLLTISIKSRSIHFLKALKLVEIMMSSPTFEKKELFRIKKTVINELKEKKENSKLAALENFKNTFYEKGDRNFCYGIDDIISELALVSRNDIKSLHNQVILSVWTCTIAADALNCANFNKFVKRIKKNKKALAPTTIHQTKVLKRTNTTLTSIPSRTNIDFSIGLPIPITIDHADYIPLSFAISVLAKWGGFAGRLMSTVRELEGLTYSIYGRLEGFSRSEQGYFRIMTFFAPEMAEQGLKSTFREMRKFYKDGITDLELKKFKIITHTQLALLQDSIEGQLNDLHMFHYYGYSVNEIEAHKMQVNKLTLDEINAVICKYLDPAKLTISGAGPIEAVKKKIQILAKNMP